ncbi:uncharacterized protein [Watersipora subatra]|uniref:uncharacterized protein n=1 Tax=Watersipora subatra TaxID=2589382 RepID=UPI00355C22B1
MLTDTQSDMLESFLLDPLNDLTPSTLEDLSDDVSSLSSNTEEINTLLSPHSEDYSQFYCNYTEKPSSVFNYTDKPLSVFNLESPDVELIGNPTDSTRSADLLDLDSVQNSSMNQLSFDLLDSNWLSTSDTRHFNLNPTSNDEIPDVSQVKRKAAKPTTTFTKAGKRRHSSQASELELQIEIEESTKRTKRCTAPLTEEQKRLRRKELNRLAAQRCRSKRKSHADVLEDEIDVLTIKNRELREKLDKLESTKTELYDIIKFHFSNCHKE